ncbi:MAG: hypothetical protein JNJ69_06630 [Leptospiraceae bacterium]|nr:hypothetical protein [Leptospiraceae bacterium]
MARCSLFLLSLTILACKTAPIKAENAAPAPQTAPPAKTEKVPENRDNPPAEKGKTEDKVQPARPRVVGRAILNPYEAEAFYAHMDEEHERFGTPARAKKYKKKKYGNSSVEQRSGRRRLYDHNLFLRALFAGQLVSEAHGNLQQQFADGLFLDIGSAILYGEGAATVRDLYEDKKIQPHLLIIASDINDRGNKKTMYIDQYRKSGRQLPFPVVEVAMLMQKPEDFTTPLKFFLASRQGGIILRSANAGPDLYYDRKRIQTHLRAAIAAFHDRNVLYFFNKFILYKPENRIDFSIIGEIDAEVGINHRETPWEDIDWSKRTFKEGIRLNQQHVQYTN